MNMGRWDAGTEGRATRVAAFVFALSVLLSPGPAVPRLQAQQPQGAARPCVIQVDHSERNNFFTMADGTQNVYSGGGVRAHCVSEPTTIDADSMAYVQATNIVQFIGHVKYRDSTGTLDADKVTYYRVLQRLYAEGNVYTRNRSSGTELRGPNLDLLRVAPPLRDTQELTATNRPIIRFHQAGDSVRGDSAHPFVVTADRVFMRHTDRMWASGRVIITRPEMDATADSATLALGDSIGFLIGSPVIVGRDSTRVRPDSVRERPHFAGAFADSGVTYRLTGRRVRFDLTGRQKVKRVLSSGDADARGPDWHLVSDTLDMAVDSSAIQRAQAWGRQHRAFAYSGLNTIEADSLDIQMPRQVMHQVRAYGRSRATSKADSTWVENDWLSGDSLRATFAAVDSADRRGSRIEHVVAYGTARAYYHTDNQRDPQGERGINYSRGDRINIAMSEGKVRTVDIVGNVDGVYLEPLPPASDTVAADSTGGARAADSTGRITADSTGRRATPADSAPRPAPIRPRPSPTTPPPSRPLPAPPRPGTAPIRATPVRSRGTGR